MVRSSPSRVLGALASSFALLALTAQARATEPAGGDKALAEALFRAAKDLQGQGKLAEACAKYVESHRLDPKPGTILNVASCHEEEGKTATAWADYAEAATFAARARQTERERFARARAEELEKRLSFVTFEFPTGQEVTVALDGKALTTAASGTRVPLDPGEHTVDVRAPGKMPWTTHVTVDAGPAERTVTIPPLADDGVSSAPPPPIVAPGSPGAPPSTQRTLGWIGVGVGGAGLVVGSVFGAMTLSETSTIDEHCRGSLCDAVGLAANDDAHASATISTVGFVVGGLALAAGVVLLVTAPPASRPPASLARPRTVGIVW